MEPAILDFSQDTVIFMDDQYYTTNGALKVMGVGTTTLSKEIKAKRIEVFNHPRGHLFSKVAILDWINRRTLHTTKKKSK